MGCDCEPSHPVPDDSGYTLGECKTFGACLHTAVASRPPRQSGRLAQLVRAPALQAGCRGFESLTAHQDLVSENSAILSPKTHFPRKMAGTRGVERINGNHASASPARYPPETQVVSPSHE
jgi:hypothetical protein